MAIGTSQAFRTQNLRLLGNLFDKNNFIGKKGYYLSSDEDGTRWIADPNETSGVFSGGILSATIGGTTFNVSAGVGQVVSRTVLPSGEVETTTNRITWNAQSNVSLTYRTTQKFSYIYIDENGTLQQQSNTFTDSQYRNQIVLGVICHINLSTINLVTNKQNVVYGDSHRLYELMSTFGPIKRSGLSVSPYGTDLRISRDSGTVLLIGSNYTTYQFEPDSPIINAVNPASICRVYRNGSGDFVFDTNNGSYYTGIEPNKYDDNSGTLQTVNNNQWTVQRLFFFPSNPNDIIVYYGFGVYNSLNDAFLAIENEEFYEAQITAENAVFLGYILVRGGAANLSLVTDARFIQSGVSRNVIVGGGGAAGLVLDDLLDVQITNPSDSQFFVYENSSGLWKNATFNVVDPLVFTKSGTSLSLALNYASATQPGGVSIGTQTFAGNKTFKDNVIVSGNLTVNGTTVTINSSTLSVDDKNIELGSVVAIPSLSSTVDIEAGDANVIVSSTNGLIVGQALTKISGTGAFGANPIITSITSATQFTVSPVHATTGSIVFSVGGATDVTADGGGITLKGTTNKTFNWVDATDSWTSSENLDLASGKTYKINAVDVLSSTTLGSGVVNSSLTSVGTLNNLTVAGYAYLATTSGNVGIGTVTPASLLHISSAGTAKLKITADTDNVDENDLGGIEISQDGGITTSYFGHDNTNSLILGVNSTTAPNIYIGTRNDGTNFVTSADAKVTILNGGNVGIGTTVPLATLDVRSQVMIGDASISGVAYQTLSVGGNTRIHGNYRLQFGSANGGYASMGITGTATGTITFNTWDGSADRERLRIVNTDGNIGIGITNPTYKLDVAGAIAMHDENQDIDSRFYGGTFLRGWTFNTGNESNITYTTDGTSPIGVEVLSVSSYVWARGPKIRLDRTQNYEVELWVRRQTANTAADFYFVVSNYDNGGNVISGDGTDWHYPIAVNPLSANWTKYRFIVGPYGGSKDHSPNARYISVGFIANYTTGTDVIYMTGFKCRPIPRYNNDNLTLYNNGFVGIGTTIPSEKLDVIGGNISTSGEIYSLGGRLSLYRNAGNSYIDWSTGRNLIFRTETSVGGAGDSEKVRINSFGYVGIGTTNPFNKLDIYGGDVNIRNDSAGATSLYLRNWTSGGTAQMVFGTAPGDDQSTSLSFASNVFKIENYGDPTSSIKFGTRNTAGTSAIRMTINPDGNVGIDTETPNNKLSVLGSTSIGSNYNVAAPTNGLIVEGSVGIGTTNPSVKFEVSGSSIISNPNPSANAAVLLVQDEGTATSVKDGTTLRVVNNGSAANYSVFEASSSASNFVILNNGNVGIGISTPAYKTEIYSGAKTSAFTGLAISNFNNYDGTATSLVTSQLRFAILENPITTYSASQRTFAILESGNEVNNSSSDGFFAISTRKTAVLSEKFRITSSGNVGIGTTNPVTKLAILGGDDKDTGPIISLSGNSINQFESGRIRFTEANIAASPFYQGAYVHYDGSNNVFNLGVHTNVDSLTSSDVNAISIVRSTAFVGIGTTIPSTKLEVIGTVKATLFDGPINQINVTADDATNSSHYLYFGATNSGASIVKASTKIRFNPSTGAFSSTTKSFRIPHLTKSGYDLVYGSLESPYHGIRLTGKGKTNGNRAEVILPDYINILVDKETVHIQLTPIKCAKILYVDDLFIDDNKFTVKYDKSWFEKPKDVEFYWDFTAERKDVPKLIVEEKQ